MAVIELGDQVWRDYTVSLANYTGTGTRIVLGSSKWTGIDDLTIDIIGACAHPYNLTIDSVTNTTAYLSWENSDSTLSYLVEYRPADSIVLPFSQTVSNVTSATLTGLDGNTHYIVRVSAICPDSTMLRAIEAEFTTECNLYAIPLVEDFEGEGELPTCWSGQYDDPTWRTRPHIEREDDGNGVLYMMNAGLVTLPEVDEDLHLLQIEFDLKDVFLSHLGGNLIVGVVEDTGFVGIDTMGHAGHYITYFANYMGGSRTIGLRIDEDFTYMEVDNLVVDYEAPCRPITALRVVDASESSLTIDWTDATMNAQRWELSINEGETLLTNNTLISITSHPYTITGMDANTYYTFTVRPVCPSSTADWVLPICAQTECGVQTITAGAPLTEDFEAGAPCWQVAKGGVLFAADSADHAYLHHINIIWRQGYHFFSPRFESDDPLTVKFIF